MHATFIGKLDRIRQQIDQNLPQVVRIANQPPRHRGVNEYAKLKCLGSRLRCSDFHGAVDDTMQIKTDRFNGHLAGFDLGDVQHVVQKRQQYLGGHAQCIDEVELLRGQACLAQ